MKRTKDTTVSLVKGQLPPKEKKEVYDWEQKATRTLEPWHLSSIALIGDVLILIMYMFIDVGISYQLPIGLTGLIVGLLLIGISMYLTYKKKWSIGVLRYSKMINGVALCITLVLLGLTLFIA